MVLRRWDTSLSLNLEREVHSGSSRPSENPLHLGDTFRTFYERDSRVSNDRWPFLVTAQASSTVCTLTVLYWGRGVGKGP